MEKQIITSYGRCKYRFNQYDKIIYIDELYVNEINRGKSEYGVKLMKKIESLEPGWEKIYVDVMENMDKYGQLVKWYEKCCFEQCTQKNEKDTIIIKNDNTYRMIRMCKINIKFC